MATSAAPEVWPGQSFPEWQDTCATLHMWTQIVGKIRLALMPMANHWWQVPLYVTCRGLTTAPMPCGARSVEIDFDFIDHRLIVRLSDGGREEVPLQPCSVAAFYGEIMGRLRGLGIDVHIWRMPVEVADAIPFDADTLHASYDAAQVQRFWRILLQAARVLTKFRCRFIGKASPVHFFWGSFDLAVSRFSGRPAPPHPGGAPNLGDWAVREAYSHEVSSCGFWPGNGGFGRPAFYAYCYPEPAGFADAVVSPAGAFYSAGLREFILPYDDVRRAASPDNDLLEFCQRTYEATADLAQWDRPALERRAKT